jgi:hypothetical protein
MDYTLLQKNSAILNYMGGPSFLRNLLKNTIKEEEISIYGPEDLLFHKSWDWLMPAWKKANIELTSTQDNIPMLYAMGKALDTVDIENLHNLIAKQAIEWCKNKQIKL